MSNFIIKKKNIREERVITEIIKYPIIVNQILLPRIILAKGYFSSTVKTNRSTDSIDPTSSINSSNKPDFSLL